jgi:hypothetical protein
MAVDADALFFSEIIYICGDKSTTCRHFDYIWPVLSQKDQQFILTRTYINSRHGFAFSYPQTLHSTTTWGFMKYPVNRHEIPQNIASSKRGVGVGL